MSSDPEFWLFGYGSLIWKPPPHYDQRIPGYVTGYVRRFWQIHKDHRGTPDKPGRVVTLIERDFWNSLNDKHTVPEERVWGTAYRIVPSKVAEVKEYLDIREINGYSIQYATFHPAKDQVKNRQGSEPHQQSDTDNQEKQNKIKQPFECLVYIGLPENPQFMGVQEPEALARHILASRGPSGENKEYLYMLQDGLEQLSRDSGDAHVADLTRRVRALEDGEK